MLYSSNLFSFSKTHHSFKICKKYDKMLRNVLVSGFATLYVALLYMQILSFQNLESATFQFISEEKTRVIISIFS